VENSGYGTYRTSAHTKRKNVQARSISGGNTWKETERNQNNAMNFAKFLRFVKE